LYASEFERAKPSDNKKPLADDQEVVLESLIDVLLRKLMGAGQSLPDDKLHTSIDTVLNSEVFTKLSVTGKTAEDKVLAQHFAVDIDGIWPGTQPDSDKSKEALAALGADGQATGSPTDGQQPPPGPATPGGASAYYTPRRPRGSGGDEEWDEDDEYYDDEDPGYRIREIFEAELLAELSQKMTTPTVGDASQQAASSPVADMDDELGCASVGTPSSLPTEPAGQTSDQNAEGALSASKNSPTERDVLLEATRAAERPPSPTFGSAPVETPVPHEGERAARPEVAADKPVQDVVVKKKKREPKNVKYAMSNDPFYPVELDGVVFDSFNLRVVFERDKTGFEESKEFPIRMNTVIAARYQILEYLGSAAFSRAVQCLDLETNKMVCMKIIKNDKDFFDQSLDEIKLLKYINVNGDIDERHCLRLFDYFYHKEHLIIVTELLRDNLYEFSKFNRECGDEPYFTLGRLQKISKQVLTALDYVHGLRLIHCI
jgi:hypothetical protein